MIIRKGIKKILYFLLFISAITNVISQKNIPEFRHITVNEGLPHTDATSVVQDQSGFVWFSTYSGLCRYDGNEIKNFRSTQFGLHDTYLNRINGMYIDKEKIWLATQGGVIYFNTKKEEFYKPEFKDLDLVNNVFQVLTNNDHLFCVSDGKLLVYKMQSEQYISVPIQTNSGTILSINKIKDKVLVGTTNGLYLFTNNRLVKKETNPKIELISYLGFDKMGNVLIGSDNGFGIMQQSDINKTVVNVEFVQFKQDLKVLGDYSNNYITSIVRSEDQSIWIGTPIGLFRYQNSSGKPEMINCSATLSSIHTNRLFTDNSGNLWVSTFGGGVNFTDLSAKSFNKIQFADQSANYIRAIYNDSEADKLYLGTRTKGLVVYNLNTKQYRFITTQDGLSSNYIRSITKDKKGLIWVGTESGINVISNEKIVKILKNDSQQPSHISDNVIYSLATDVYGQIWAGSWHKGLNRISTINNNKHEIEKYYDDPKGMLSGNKVTSVYADPVRPEVFVSTSKGLDHIFLNNDGSVQKVFHYTGIENSINSLTSNFIWPVIRSDIKTLWVGTIGGGLNKLTLDLKGGYEAKSYTTTDGLASNDVESLQIDNEGKIWIAGKGLSVLDPETNLIIKYDAKDGLQSNIFKIGASFKDVDGRLFFGGVNGLNYFYPDQIKQSDVKIPIAITDVLINNVTASTINGDIEDAISFISELNLRYNQNNLIIRFSALDFANNEKCQYRYKMIGFNENWVIVENKNRFAAYSNLNYGEYKFVLQATNHDGVWMDQTKELKIKITPPWWLSIWAKLFYFVFVIGFLYAIYKYQTDLLKLNQKLEIQELEKKNEDELYQMRLQFFTNISHELRTPLSLIISPIENLIAQKTESDEKSEVYNLIYRNANRLLKLVNELLDFRKAEVGMLKIKASKINLQEFLTEIIYEFEEIASDKDITVIKKLDYPIKTLYADQNVISKIIFNMLSNAFKYTPNNSKVILEICKEPTLSYINQYEIGDQMDKYEYVWIKVADEGIGLDIESLNHIFERFYRVTEEDKDRLPGSGIGLAFVKSLVLAHRGIIKVSSEQGKGTEFLIGLPLGKEYLSKDELFTTEDEYKEFQNPTDPAHSISITDDSKKYKPKLLIVEDNHDMRLFLSEQLSVEYHVLIATDGEKGLELALQEIPDMIISDVMMPHKDGFELTKDLKSNDLTKNIPIILLTAKSSDESLISGSEVGADAYITKPFNLKLLKLTIHNLFEAREKLKSYYTDEIFRSTRGQVVSKRENEFLTKFVQVIENHLDDNNLDVDLICMEVAMSRTKLYSKIQELTGQPVGEFIRKLRLKKAAEILVSQDVTIQEAMDRVGIQSQSYFTKAFKKEFGKTPSRFIHDYDADKEPKKA